MKIKISVRSEGGATWVDFSCSCGDGTGTWWSDAPTPGQEYFVELDSDVVLELGRNAHAARSKRESLRISQSGNALSAVLMLISDEKTGAFHFGDGMIELELENVNARGPLSKHMIWNSPA